VDGLARFILIPIYHNNQNPSYPGELKQKMVETTKKKNTPETKSRKPEPTKSKTGTGAATKSKK